MTVKFRIGFTITSNSLFSLIAQVLPVEDISVEELPPMTAHRLVKELLPGADLATIKRVTAKVERTVPQKKRASPGPNLNKGVNAVIITALKEEPKRAGELQPMAVAAGFSANSVNSRLEALREHKVIEPIGDGRWRMVK